MFVIRLLSGRRDINEKARSQLKDLRVNSAFTSLRLALRDAREECHLPNRITKLKGGMYEFELQVIGHEGGHETRTYRVSGVNGESTVELLY